MSGWEKESRWEKEEDHPDDALWEAAGAHGGAQRVRKALERGADPNQTDFGERTPGHIAAAIGETETIRELLRKGWDPSSMDHRGKTAEDLAMEFGKEEAREWLRQERESRLARAEAEEMGASSPKAKAAGNRRRL